MIGARLGRRSLERLATCDAKLQTLIKEAAKDSPFDFTVLCGHRGEEEQNAAYSGGFSSTPWPLSKHNATPSLAVDIAPWPVDWEDLAAFKVLSDHVQSTADRLGIKIRRGGTFKKAVRGRISAFADWPHHELVEK